MFLPPSPRQCHGCMQTSGVAEAPHRLAAWHTSSPTDQQPGRPSSLADPAVLHDSSSDSFAKALEASLSWMIRGYHDLEQVGDMWRSTHGNPPVPALAITVRFDASGPAVVLPQLPPLPQIQPGK